MRLVHTLPFFIRSTAIESDLQMAHLCLKTLCRSRDEAIVVYNQGPLSHQTVEGMLRQYTDDYSVLGDGKNVGIPIARQTCFEFVFANFPALEFISEIHIDMVFPKNWYIPLIDFLMKTGEPMVCPGIITSYGDLLPEKTHVIDWVEFNESRILDIAKEHTRNNVVTGFVHPVVHRVEALRAVGGYDCDFLTGQQGYEDVSLLLSYLYYMGTKSEWRPKCCLNSRVFHATMAQRMTLENISNEFLTNLRGLARQYGAYGFKHLSMVTDQTSDFERLFNDLRNQV